MDVYRELISKSAADNSSIPSYTPLSRYNIFHVLGIQEKEVVMCRFLADLLNPEGRHEHGTLFLRSFLQDVLKKYPVNDTLLSHTDVIREFVIDHNRRIDLVIRNAVFFIPVEVKIYAGEQEGQCHDYYQYARNSRIVYLTRFGEPPSEYSRKAKDGTFLPLENIQCISWADHICGWLAKLLPQLSAPVKLTVMQYIDAVAAVTDQKEEKMMKKNMEILYRSPDYFNAGIQIEKTMKAAKLQLIRLVFEDFRKEMDSVAPIYGLEPETNTFYYSYEEKQHEKFYDCYSTYPGLNYVITAAKFQKDSLQMWFRIEVEHQLFAGISLFDTAQVWEDGNGRGWQVNDITDEIIDEAALYLNRDVIVPVDWWFTWCYPNGKHQVKHYDDVPDFKNMNPCAVSLVDSRQRREFVKSAVKNFEKHILTQLLKRP